MVSKSGGVAILPVKATRRVINNSRTDQLSFACNSWQGASRVAVFHLGWGMLVNSSSTFSKIDFIAAAGFLLWVINNCLSSLISR